MSRRRRAYGYRVYLNERVYVETKLLPSHILELDMSYQRQIELSRVAAMVEKFDPYIVNPLKVSHRNGRYRVLDGGHTLMMLKDINSDKDSFLVECRVYENLTYQEENIIFAKQTGIAKPISIKNKMNALENAEDPETMEIIQATEESGHSLAIKKSGDGSIKAVGKARSLFRKCGEEIYKEALTLIHETWGNKGGSLNGNILGGTCVFLKTFGEAYSRDRFIKKLKTADPRVIITSAKRGKTSYQTLDASVATEIAAIYNYGGGKGRLDPVKASRVVEY